MYATNSVGRLSKAKQMIEAVALRERMHAEGKKAPTRNPFSRPWGLQRDGDLWEQAWQAIQKRGSKNQDLRKVKGDATDEDIAAGISKEEDQQGN